MNNDYRNYLLSTGLDVKLVFIILILFFTQWHVIFGLISPYIRDKVFSKTNNSLDDNYFDSNKGFFTWKFRIIVPIVVFALLAYLLIRIDNISSMKLFYLFLWMILPTILLHIKKWYTLFFSVIWVWFGIEWNSISTLMGTLGKMVGILDIFIGLFILVWPLITTGRYVPLFDWKISFDDFKLALKGITIATVIILPLGILVNFLTINFSNLSDTYVKDGFFGLITQIILTFLLIFIATGVVEEFLFRDIIFRHLHFYLEEKSLNSVYNSNSRKINYNILFMVLGIVLIATIPFWDEVLKFLIFLFPGISFFNSALNTIKTLDRPLGQNEGRAINSIASLPSWIFYFGIALLIGIISLVIYKKYKTPLVAAWLTQAMIFGFAHFEDWRYVFFAFIAGLAYGGVYYKTKNIVAAAIVHMGIDAVWSLILQF